MDDQRLIELANAFIRDSKPKSLKYLERYRTVIVQLINAGQTVKQVHKFLSMPEIGVACPYDSFRRWIKKNVDLHSSGQSLLSLPSASVQSVRTNTANETVDKKVTKTVDNLTRTEEMNTPVDAFFPEDPMVTIAKLRKQAAEQKAAAANK